jgi:hypothetical protein
LHAGGDARRRNFEVTDCIAVIGRFFYFCCAKPARNVVKSEFGQAGHGLLCDQKWITTCNPSARFYRVEWRLAVFSCLIFPLFAAYSHDFNANQGANQQLAKFLLNNVGDLVCA